MKQISVHPAAEENPGFLLWQVSTLWSRSTTAALKPFGLTHPQFILLAIIDQKVVCQEDVEKLAVMDPKTTSHMLRSLRVKGLIDQGALTLTPAGKEMMKQLLPIIESADTAFFASLDLKNSKMVSSLQTLASSHLSKNDGESCSD